jgi:plasmid stability protein
VPLWPADGAVAAERPEVAELAITADNAIIAIMASITIRNIDPQLKARLRVRAARHARSMEAEVRAILRDAVAAEAASRGSLATAIARCFEAVGGVDLKIPPREPIREPPKFR